MADNSHVPHSRREEPSATTRHHHATRVNEGPPALYQLNVKTNYIDGNNKKLRQWTYGRRDKSKKNKIILIVGETGTGKTTLINTMVNHQLRVKFEDQEFYQITEEEQQRDQSQSQTSEITVYEVFVEENPTSLTIIDTPGYGDTRGHEKDAEVAEYLIRLFSDVDGVHYIDAVCFVMKASQNRLSGKELYIFHSVLSLFGRDIQNNIVFLFTHSDGLPPTDALNAIEKAEIPCRRDSRGKPVHFLFNNRQKEKKDEEYEHVFRSAWEMGERSISKFFTLLEEKNKKSVQMTLDVMRERTRLDACVCNLKERIIEKELKTVELTQIQEVLKVNRDKIKNRENFYFTISKVVKEKVQIKKKLINKATSCSVCKETCHDEWGCWLISARNLSKCEVMVNGYCTVCSGKCHYSKHVKENSKYVIKTVNTKVQFDELRKEYEHMYTEIEVQLTRDLVKIKTEKSKLLQEVYFSITRLSDIALKADSAFTLQHLDFLIPRLKEEEGNEEWVKNLEELKKTGEEQKNKGAVHHLMDLGLRKWNQFFSHN